VNVTSYFTFPPNFEKSGLAQPVPMPYRPGSGSWGYHHMCRFWNSEVFKVPEVARVDYIMRMDTDALILTEYRSDPFVQMQRQGAVYGYKCVMPDFPPFVKGGW
jgi:hypothetical protein